MLEIAKCESTMERGATNANGFSSKVMSNVADKYGENVTVFP